MASRFPVPRLSWRGDSWVSLTGRCGSVDSSASWIHEGAPLAAGSLTGEGMEASLTNSKGVCGAVGL